MIEIFIVLYLRTVRISIY